MLAQAVGQLADAGWPERAAGRRVGLLVADGTRAWEPEPLFSALRPTLESAAALDVFVCTGTHDPSTPENRRLGARLRTILRSWSGSVQLHVPNLEDPADYRSLGWTARGTPIEVHAALGPCETLLVLSDMKHHYFAGYSNASKYVVPGLATRATARANHFLALEPQAAFGRHPWHPDPRCRNNPLAADLVDAFERVVAARTNFALATISTTERLLWGAGGEVRDVSARGMAAVDRLLGHEVDPVRFLVVSAGGAPYDESLYTAQRALELSRAAVAEGGEVLFLAECSNGIGPPGARENFFEPLARGLDRLSLPSRAEYELYGHKPVKLARLLERLAEVHFHTALEREDAERLPLRLAPDPQAVIDGWVKRLEPGERIGFLDDASKLGIRARASGSGS